MSNLRLFVLSILCTMVGMLLYLYVQHERDLRNEPKLIKLADNVFLTSQLMPDHMRHLRRQRFEVIVNMRPDGEVVDQPSSEAMKTAAAAADIEFHYIPVPHESLPDEAATALQSILERSPDQTVLYCRTGRRAARLYALACASQTDGPPAEDILEVVRSVGFTADDLRDQIDLRISKRTEKLEKP